MFVTWISTRDENSVMNYLKLPCDLRKQRELVDKAGNSIVTFRRARKKSVSNGYPSKSKKSLVFKGSFWRAGLRELLDLPRI